MWGEIGVRAKINRVPWSTIAPVIIARDYQGANCHGTGGRADPINLLNIVLPSTGGFTVGFDHPILDDLLSKAVGTVDTEERFKIVGEIGRFVYEQAAESGIYSVNILWPLGPRVDSWKEHLEYGDPRGLSGTEYTPHRK